MLGLVREPEFGAAKVLANLKVELTKVRSAIEFFIGRDGRETPAEIGLTPRSKKLIEHAVEEGRRYDSDITTVHLLIGVVREDGGVAAGVLESLGVTLEKLRSEADRIHSLNPGQPTGSRFESHDDSVDPSSDWPPELTAVANALRATRNAKNEAIDSGKYERAARLRDREFALAEQFRTMRGEWPRP